MVSPCDEVGKVDEHATSEPILFTDSNLDEDMLAVAYLRMKTEGLLEIVYHESVPPLSEFLSYHNRKQEGYHYLGVFQRLTLDSPAVMIGIGWLWNVSGRYGARKGEVGFVFFRDHQKHGIPVKATRLMLEYCFLTAKVDIVVGTTPVKNRAALVFDKRLGFTQLPTIPHFCYYGGEPCDAVISYMTKEMWNGTAASK